MAQTNKSKGIQAHANAERAVASHNDLMMSAHASDAGHQARRSAGKMVNAHNEGMSNMHSNVTSMGSQKTAEQRDTTRKPLRRAVSKARIGKKKVFKSPFAAHSGANQRLLGGLGRSHG